MHNTMLVIFEDNMGMKLFPLGVYTQDMVP